MSVMTKNQDKLLFLNIESTYAVDCLEKLLSYDGVDGVFVGPHDLSVSMNCPEEWDNKEYQETISKIIRITRAAKKSIAVHWSFNKATERQLKWIDEGANMVLHSSDIKLFNNT